MQMGTVVWRGRSRKMTYPKRGTRMQGVVTVAGLLEKISDAGRSNTSLRSSFGSLQFATGNKVNALSPSEAVCQRLRQGPLHATPLPARSREPPHQQTFQ